jgi:Family of unknown function (DUF6183)
VAADLSDDELDLLVHRADLDGLVRLIDARTAGRDWDGLRRVRDRSRAALATGRQLWPAATLAEYRLALRAPAPWAAAVVVEGAGRFAVGPLTEVVAQHHAFAELAPHLDPGPHSVYVAYECALRGEAVDPGAVARLGPLLDVPLEVEDWEPAYVLAEYRDGDADFPTPAIPQPTAAVDGSAPDDRDVLDDVTTELAVRSLVDPWTSSSNGRVSFACVRGDAGSALGALGVDHARLAPLTAAEAVGWLAWAGASGGAHGRRKGAAAGRYDAWWMLASLGDLVDTWPPRRDEIAELLGDLDWWWWDADEPLTGWQLRLVVHDHADGVAWAIAASDTD